MHTYYFKISQRDKIWTKFEEGLDKFFNNAYIAFDVHCFKDSGPFFKDQSKPVNI